MSAAEKLEELRTLTEVRAMTGMGTTWIYEQMGTGAFPRPIKIGRRSLWVLSEVDAWIKAQVRAARA